jgi:hypothetical protein
VRDAFRERGGSERSDNAENATRVGGRAQVYVITPFIGHRGSLPALHDDHSWFLMNRAKQVL